jgi:hypothetical protein
MKKQKKNNSFIKVLIVSILLGTVVIGLLLAWNYNTSLTPRYFTSKATAFSVLVPRYFTSKVEGSSVTITNGKATLYITRNLWAKSFIFPDAGGRATDPRIMTAKEVDPILSSTYAHGGTLTDSEYQKNLIEKGYVKVDSETKHSLDNKTIYRYGGCYFIAYDKNPYIMFDMMNILVEKNQYDSVRICSGFTTDVSDKDREGYYKLFDTIVLSMEDISGYLK